MEETRVTALRCSGCGASLQIGFEIEHFTCAHCGTPQVVERSGGIVHLRKVAESIVQVQRGTDKTAAELALKRLPGEIKELEERRINVYSRYENKIRLRRENLLYSSGAIAFMILIGSLFVVGFLGNAIFGSGVITGTGILLSLVTAVGVGLYSYLQMEKLDRFETSSLTKQKDAEISDLSNRIALLQTKVHDNYEIANS